MLSERINKKKYSKRQGFTLVELLVGAFILSVVVLGVYQAFASVMRTVIAARIKTEAMMLANEQIEIARNLSYQDVGILNGLPPGKIPREQHLTRGGISFGLLASVRDIDDPFDGVRGSSTNNDTAGADYKLVEFIVSCDTCSAGVFAPQTIVSTVAPRNLEITTGNGALFINVFNANGDPVSGAGVHIVNNQSGGSINIDEITNNAGIFQLVDTPPAGLAYEVIITKAGYSTDGTVATSTANPNPLIPPSTVAGGLVTQLSFSIDRLAHLQVQTINPACSVQPGMSVHLVGQKKIGQEPDVYKYDQTLVSDGAGLINLPSQEWDTYRFLIATTSAYALAGTLPVSPLALAPAADQSISLVIVPKVSRGLLVVVTDTATGLPLSDAQVTVGGRLLLSSQGYFSQTDWSGGSGQPLYLNEQKYAADDGNIDGTSVVGDIRLRSALDQYLPDGYLTSSVFDTGGTTTQYAYVRWNPADQTASTSVRLQIASGNDPATTTWNWLGPDGTAGSYYTVPNTTIGTAHNGDQFVRYKIYLETASSTLTPNVSDVGLTFTSSCTPPGQAYFDGLSGGSQNISITRDGYNSHSSFVNTADVWQMITIPMQKLP